MHSKNFFCSFHDCLCPNNQKSPVELDFLNFLHFLDTLMLCPIHIRNFSHFCEKFFLNMSADRLIFLYRNFILHTLAILHILHILWHQNCLNRPILTMFNLRSTCARFCEKGFRYYHFWCVLFSIKNRPLMQMLDILTFLIISILSMVGFYHKKVFFRFSINVNVLHKYLEHWRLIDVKIDRSSHGVIHILQ